MSLILDGTNGLSDIDGSAAAPAIRGTDANTGIFFPAADTIAFAEGGVEAMRIDSDGDVGIGTTTPSHKLDVLANSNASIAIGQSSDDPFIWFDRSDGGSNRLAWRLRESSGRALIFETGTNATKYGQTFTEAARIDSSGNLLVGTTSVDAAGSKVQLSSSGNRVFTVQNTANVNGDQALWVKLGSNCNNTSSPGFIYDTGGTNRLIIWGNGNVVNTNNSYGAISDIKLKENIVDATPKLDKLNQVRVVNYNLIGEEQKQLGVIAQELEQLFPSMIDESPDRDVEGNDLGTTTKSVKYSVFVPMLIKAIQEQQALITALTTRITALEGAAA
jgi:hypothetical protein